MNKTTDQFKKIELQKISEKLYEKTLNVISMDKIMSNLNKFLNQLKN
jgi:hypothetical protein